MIHLTAYISKLSELENRICQPDPAYYPNHEQRKELYLRNVAQLKSNIHFLIIYGVINIFFTLQSYSHLFWLSLVSLHLSSLLIFCRKRLWISYWIYTPSVTFGQLIFIELNRDSFVYVLVTSFLTPFCVFEVTKSFRHVLFNFLGQLILLHFKYRYVLEEVIIESTATDFAEKFVTAATFALIAISTIYSLFQKSLRDYQDQLKVSKLEVEKAYSQLTLFLQTFSHELRNPLNSLLGNLQLALHEDLPPKANEMIETAKICADLLLQLINNILDSGKVQTGKLDFSLTSVKITDFVIAIWRISRDLIKRKNLNGSLKIDRNLPVMLNIDGYRLNQVLLNLLSNAIKFTDRGDIKLIFSWIPDMTVVTDKCFEPNPYDDEGLFDKEHNFQAIRRSNFELDSIMYINSELSILKNLASKLVQHQSQGVLKIIVRDTGAGMRSQDLELLFNKFAQVGDDTTKKKIGTGLGLYITKQICETMGGRIRVYSKEKLGTTFIVCIPVTTSENITQALDVSNPIDQLKQMNLQLLLVDDNSFNLDLLTNYASKIDAKVIEFARDGYEGYQKFLNLRRTRKSVDVILLDIDMPVMDGKMMCKKIREYEEIQRLPPVKIIFVTGNYDEAQMKELLDQNSVYNGNAFIKKPVSFEIFVNMLSKIMK